MNLNSQRLEQVRQMLRKNGVDCLALIPGSNLRWLTGLNFGLMERALIFFIPANDDPILLLPALEKIKWDSARAFPARVFSWNDQEGPLEAARQAAEALAAVKTVAVEELRMRVMEYKLVRRNLPDVQIAQAEAIMTPLRLHKEQSEVEAMRKAVKVCEAALEDVVSRVAPNMTEHEIAGELSRAMLLHGADGVPDEPQVLSGPRSALPHGGPTERRVLPGEFLLFDFVSTVEGYYADITRTFVVGRPPDERQRTIYQTVLKANETGRKLVCPDLTCEAVDEAVRSVIESAGFGENFVHRTGHGLGLEVHEPPYLVADNRLRLANGMAVTIEPGIYLPGWGGVRIEDDVVLTEGGSDCLTTFNRELRVIGT